MSAGARSLARRSAPLLAALFLAACAVTCRRALTNPADPASPNYPGEPATIDPGPELAASIGDTLVFLGTFLGDTSHVAEYAWDFEGDGTVDWRGRGAVRHAYRAVGSYPARFFVYGVAGDRESAATLVTITDQPPSGGIGPDTLVVPGESFVLSPRVSDDGRIVRYSWDLTGDGEPDYVDVFGGTIIRAFYELGDHIVSLTVVDEDGRTSTFGRRFRACPLPPIPVAVSPPDSFLETPARCVLRWETIGGCAAPLTYDVYIDTTETAEQLVVSDLTTPAHYLGVLPHGQTYSWRVIVKDAGGRRRESPVFTFTIRAVPVGMVYIESATVPIGSPRSPDESPEHDTFIDAYYMDERETTRYEYTAFLVSTGYVPEGSFTGVYPVGTEDFPVSGVTWNDAAAYAAWRGKRLPTEAEWEHAAKGNRDTVFPWGNRIVLQPCNYANVAEFPSDYCVGTTVRTLSYPRGKSWIGVWDAAGNVAEWVADWYDPQYYLDPLASVLPTGPATGTEKVFRGGSWSSYFLEYSTTRRSRRPPSSDSDEIGFRCALSIEAPSPTPPPP